MFRSFFYCQNFFHPTLKGMDTSTSDPPSSAGGLSLAVEGPSKAEISCKDNKDGTCTVSYLPTAPGDYNIIVKFDDKHIAGSPFTTKITGTNLLEV